jgi:hypothetical protein
VNRREVAGLGGARRGWLGFCCLLRWILDFTEWVKSEALSVKK